MSDVAIDTILGKLSEMLGVDRAEVKCEVYMGLKDLYSRFSGIAAVLSDGDLKRLVALSEEIDAHLFVGQISKPVYDPEHADWKKGVEVSMTVGPVRVERTSTPAIAAS
jgi:hypothetical protein